MADLPLGGSLDDDVGLGLPNVKALLEDVVALELGIEEGLDFATCLELCILEDRHYERRGCGPATICCAVATLLYISREIKLLPAFELYQLFKEVNELFSLVVVEHRKPALDALLVDLRRALEWVLGDVLERSFKAHLNPLYRVHSLMGAQSDSSLIEVE